MAYEFKTKRRVEFADTDMAGIMHFSNFFRFMETAEHAFYRTLGFSVHPEFIAGQVGWPRVHASCDYKHPLRFEEEVEIHLLIHKIGSKSITYTFIFRTEINGRPVEVARGTMTIVAVAFDPATRKMKSVTIPADIAAKLEVAPTERLKEEK
jgi:YbgC/YbaW family acyl-CoA thioester hydrolase